MSANDLEIIKRLAGLTKGEAKVENAAPVVEAKVIVESTAAPVVTAETNPEITSGSTFLKFLEEVSTAKQTVVEAEKCEDEEKSECEEDEDEEKEEVSEAKKDSDAGKKAIAAYNAKRQSDNEEELKGKSADERNPRYAKKVDEAEECEDEEGDEKSETDEKVEEGLTQEDVANIRNLITEAAKQKDNQTVAAALADSILALQRKFGFQNVQEMVIAAGGTITMTKNGNEIAWEEVAEEAGITQTDLEVLGLKKIW